MQPGLLTFFDIFHPFNCFIMLSPNMITDFELSTNFLLAWWFLFCCCCCCFQGLMQYLYLFPLNLCHFEWGGLNVVVIYNIAILFMFFFGDDTGVVDGICFWYDFCSIFVCFTFSGTVNLFFWNIKFGCMF